jgi:hypothetical protein
MPGSCVCIGGVNYTKACSCMSVQCCCGANPVSMSTVNPSANVGQSVCGGCGGASGLSNALNAIGKWGTVLTATVQGKPVAATKTGVAVGAKGASSLGGAMSGGSLILILIVVGVLIFMATGK